MECAIDQEVDILSCQGASFCILIFFHETRREMRVSPPYNYVSRCRDIPPRGGRVAIGVDKILTYSNLTHLILAQINEQAEMIFVQIVHEQFEVFALNVYFNSYNRQRKYLKPLEQWILDLISRKPHATFIVAGDFNTARQPIQHLQPLLEPTVMTFRRTIKGRLVQSRTDWVMVKGQILDHETVQKWYEQSHHSLVLSVIEIPNQKPKATHIKIPDAAAAKLLCEEAAKKSTNLDEFLTQHHLV